MEPEKNSVTGIAGDGQRLSGQRRLIDFDRIAFKQARISGHDVAQPHPDDIARDQFARRRV